jgi:hypothetical protein
VRTLTLREAREAAQNARVLVRNGIDPVVARQKNAANLITFEQAAGQVHALHVAGWSNGKHQDQWLASLRNHVFPLIGKKSVAEIIRTALGRAAGQDAIWSKVMRGVRGAHAKGLAIAAAMGLTPRDGDPLVPERLGRLEPLAFLPLHRPLPPPSASSASVKPRSTETT